ncbi:MAG: SpoIID/LytB domain-containing protein [Blautia sp.]|uniref:SpoIID/LytB domain-containing protein n=1 Tax=Blautia sp. TaxID=1955243 RepID=UPI002E79641F|nr:SpoIID/LytB domain-containing protein [Blautia sp.]MEE1444662.1 SpoIID/LytB domain-containing protein [Blautia sp.]
MDWKQKIKWKLMVILIALLGILVVWCAGKAGEKKNHAVKEILREHAVKENEWASLLSESEPQEKEVQKMPSVQEKEETTEDQPKIQVLLMTNGYESYYHTEIIVQAQGNYEIQGNLTGILKNGETMKLQRESPEFSGSSVKLLPENPENRLKVLSLTRGQGNPAYRGSLTVYEDENGLRMVNELPLEQYLCAVVPSEMPSSYPKEALKAQAVCARTYAVVQMQAQKRKDLGAQVDDSVSFQVYGNSQEAESSNEAVKATEGKILLNQGMPITAYYFSTSHGKTSTDEVWEASAPSAYLKSVACTYDASEPWFQWQTEISMEKLLENAKNMYGEISKVQGLEIKETGEGDAVLNLVLQTDQGMREIRSEYDIRSLLAPSGNPVIRQDGSSVKGGTLLPSAYFTLEESRGGDGNLQGYKIVGGGYGHGVGMSQNGAKGMAQAGKSYQEILSYFYQEVELGNVQDVVNP